MLHMGLRLIITFGFFIILIRYTGASFSGRMPCGDIADSVVETAKSALLKSIEIIVNFMNFNKIKN